MRILCCWTAIRPETKAALEAHGHRYERTYVDCSASETRYHEELQRYWDTGEDWVNVEHDIVIDDWVLPAFEACPEPWCVAIYELAGGFVPGVLGCVRFRAQLMAALPDAMRQAGASDNTGVPERAWWRTDVRLDRILRDEGYLPHIHGRVEHLNEKQKLVDPDSDYRQTLERCAHHVAADVA